MLARNPREPEIHGGFFFFMKESAEMFSWGAAGEIEIAAHLSML